MGKPKNRPYRQQINRRKLLKGAGGASLGTLLAMHGFGRGQGFGGLAAAAEEKPKFLIVMTCSGGASILDSFMAMTESEVTAAGGDPARLNCFVDADVTRFADHDLRAVSVNTQIATLGGYPIATNQTEFVRKHGADTMVVTTEGTSVNHGIAQKRSLTGNDAWHGRTIQEAVAAHFGGQLPIANLNMGSGGFGLPGIDPSLPAFAHNAMVSDPLYWALGLHSNAGLSGVPADNLLAMARNVRNEALEPGSNFVKTFSDAPAIRRWINDRQQTMNQYEAMDLINKLSFIPEFDNISAPDAETLALRQAFPDYAKDSLDAQAILGYQAITKGVSCAVTLGPTPAAITEGLDKFYNPPIAFDFSHTDHRGTQAMMWERCLRVTDKLIDLLKQKEFDPATGESYWDRTMIYFASDFGRDKVRPSGSTAFSSGHHLNNASVIISPMANGGKILGGLDYTTGLTYGFDINSGTPEPGRLTSEKELYAGILGVMGVDTSGSGLPDIKAMRRNG